MIYWCIDQADDVTGHMHSCARAHNQTVCYIKRSKREMHETDQNIVISLSTQRAQSQIAHYIHNTISIRLISTATRWCRWSACMITCCIRTDQNSPAEPRYIVGGIEPNNVPRHWEGTGVIARPDRLCSANTVKLSLLKLLCNTCRTVAHAQPDTCTTAHAHILQLCNIHCSTN